MSIETALFVTTFALISASLLLSGRKNSLAPANPKHGKDTELDALFRPVLLFTTTAPVAHC
jgi:hypothetical protein